MKKTRNDGGTENVEHDRISSLPDEVLSHILSFLSTNEAVQTCVLSKRWKHTWAAVPILDIKQKDFSVFWDDDCSEEDDDNVVYIEALRMSAARFERFMIGFLDHRAPTNLDRFCCMRHIHSLEPGASVGWLDRVALLMPQLMDIVIFSSTLIDMPYLVFSCANLHHLTMFLNANGTTIIRPESINLPSLKFLALHGVELHNDFAEKLFMGCPSLERLKLCFCELYFSGISSEVLKELTLDGILYEHMQISCPNLVSLCMMIFLKGDGISLKNMSSLVNVYIELYRGDDVQNLNLLGSLSNVAKLELYLGTTLLKEQLEKDTPNCRNFNNLKKLVIAGWDMCSDFYLIACLLKHSPNLKELSLLLDENQCETQEPPRDVSGDILFWHEYLEIVKIGDLYERVDKLSSKLINAVIKTLDLYVKKIGNLIIT